MTRQIIIFSFFITNFLSSYGQDTLSKVKLSPYYGAWGMHLEYSHFNSNSIGLGINYIVEPLHKFILKRQVAYTFDLTLPSIFYKDNFILGQRIDIGVNCEKMSPDIHVFFEHNDKNDFRIGGKIGLSFGNFIYLHYRYSLPLSDYENNNISRHGLTLTFKYNWVAVSHLYGP